MMIYNSIKNLGFFCLTGCFFVCVFRFFVSSSFRAVSFCWYYKSTSRIKTNTSIFRYTLDNSLIVKLSMDFTEFKIQNIQAIFVLNWLNSNWMSLKVHRIENTYNYIIKSSYLHFIGLRIILFSYKQNWNLGTSLS